MTVTDFFELWNKMTYEMSEEMSKSQYLLQLVEEGPIDWKTRALARYFDKTAKHQHCSEHHVIIPYHTDIKPRKRVILHVQHAEFEGSVQVSDVTIVTQVTVERLYMLHGLVRSWPGPLLASVYIPDTGFSSIAILRFYDWLAALNRPDIKLILVMQNETLYPVNWLRNLGIKYALTDYIFLLDVDFLPSNSLYSSFRRYSQVKNLAQTAIVYPKFQMVGNATPTLNKSGLQESIEQGHVTVFHAMFPEGSKYSNFSRWWNTSEKYYPITNPDCFSRYEPLVIARKTDHSYLPETILYGCRDQNSYFSTLCHHGFTFQVDSTNFVLHRPHPKHKRNFAGKARLHMMRCGEAAYRGFQQYLSSHQGKEGNHGQTK